MKRSLLILVTLLLLKASVLLSDEGMWLLPLLEKLNYATMQQMGLELTPEQIYSINNTSLKDAVVIFGNGCTGEIVSPDGLILTNHHCGSDEIQNHSLGEHNYLKDGFWAMDRSQELPNPGLTVTFLISIKEVTGEVLENISDETKETEREEIIEKKAKELEENAIDGTHYEASVRSFFKGNRYFLFVYEKYRDVRLVGAPPESIGNFGGDTDNWMWPRHTGDFSMFRVYSDKNGNPAEYSPDNIPLKARFHLPISLKGIHDGDFTMILGNPGRTQRYISSWGLQEIYEIINPNRIKIRGVRQDILREDMRKDEKINNMYSTKYERSSNYWKYSIGQNRGIKRLNLIEKKKSEEKEFTGWIEADAKRTEKYKNVLSDIETYYKNRKEAYSNLQKISEVFFRGIELTDIASRFLDLYMLLSADKTSDEAVSQTISDLKNYSDDFYKEYNLPTDKKVAVALLRTYDEMTPVEYQPGFYSDIHGKYKGNYTKYVEKLYDKSVFVSKEKLSNFLEHPELKTLEKDPAMNIVRSIQDRRLKDITIYNTGKNSFDRAVRLYMEGRIEMHKDKKFYPDANFTMRLTCGTISDYNPADAVHYRYYTTLSGVMEKEDPNNPEFIVPDKLKKLYKQKDYGRYGEDNYMPVCFTSNNDITGGNSGSPVLNGKGELIGIAFDGNWEAMSGDIVFEKGIQKTISVDIRYVLFIIDKFAGARHLVDEMTLIE